LPDEIHLHERDLPMIRSPRALGLVALSVLAAGLTVAPGPARAQGTGPETADVAARNARREFQRAEAAFNLGKFEQALAGYEAAYQAKPLPALLFNIAQCHRHLGNSDRALFFYRRYLALDPNSPNRATVEQLIAETERRRDRPSEATTPPPTVVPPFASNTSVVSPPPVASPPLPVAASPAAPPPVVETPAVAASPKAAEPAPPGAASPTGIVAAPAPVFVSQTPQPTAESEPGPTRWWLWATVAGVVVAGAATAVLLSTGRRDPARPTGGLGVIDWR